MVTFNTFERAGALSFAKVFRRDGALLVFQHIPKTAGSSLTRELQLCLAPYHNIHFPNFDPGTNRIEGLNTAVDAFVTAHATQRFRSCSGHLRLPHLTRLREAVPEAQVFTFLRDPVERYVSEYRYMRTPAYPQHVAAIEKYPDFETYLATPETHNKQWSFVAPAAQDATPDKIKAVFNRYCFIGVVEELQICMAFLTGLTGFPKYPSAYSNKTTRTDQNDVEMTPELRARVREANHKDVALYESVSVVLAAQRQAMTDMCEDRRGQYLLQEVSA